MNPIPGTVVFVLQFVVPFLIISFCYTMISLKLGKVCISELLSLTDGWL